MSTQNLAEALPAEMARVRDEVIPAYAPIGAPGAFAVMSMRAELDAATKAIMDADVVAMLRCYNSLKEFHT